MLSHFITQDSGAVTVDWTVLAAAIVGLGVTSVAAVRTGSQALGENVDASLSGAQVNPLRWLTSRDLVRQTFAGGNTSGWSRSQSSVFGEWGTMLGPFGGDTRTNPVTYGVTLSPGSTNAMVEFDLILSDSWDGLGGPNNPFAPPEGDRVLFQINGQTISAEAFVHQQNHAGFAPSLFAERQSSVQIGGTTYNLTLRPTNLPTGNMAGDAGHEDQRWRVSLEAVNAPQSFTLGYGSTSRQAVGNEAFGLANFSVREN